jgi:hypothetical protein
MTAWWAASSISTVSTIQSSETRCRTSARQKACFSADFLRSAVAVSPSLRASFVSWALLGRLSPPAKIPFPGQVGRSRLGANVVS